MSRKSHQTTPTSLRLSRGATWAAIVAVVVVAAVALIFVMGQPSEESGQIAEANDAAATGVADAAAGVVDVYKDPGCGCCSKWAEHLREHGFTVRTTDVGNLAALKTSHDVPQAVYSCHTALVGDYVIEGHVPASDIQRLLRERPPVAGLAVAGMPIGSPGMEMPGRRPELYDVMAFDGDGSTRVFAKHGG